MKISVQKGDITQIQVDAIIVNLFEGIKKPGGETGAVDKALKGALQDEIRLSPALTGKLGETYVLNIYNHMPARYVIIVGLGKVDELDEAKIRRASAAAIRACLKLQVKSVASVIHGMGTDGYDPKTSARLLTEGTLLGSYQFTLGKSKEQLKKAPQRIQKFVVVESDAKKQPAIKEGVKQGEAIALGVNTARDLVFDSPNHVTPTYLKKTAESLSGLTLKVLGQKDLAKLKMGAFLSVAKGSDEPPYLIHLSYRPKAPAKGKTKTTKAKKITLVGKGITFDSGGLSLKPSKNQELMKMDMAGAGAVLGVMKAISELGDLNVQVDGFIATCENMPSARASKPGDIVTTRKGTTVEINNTDAEGRLILIDTLTYAQEIVDPDEMIDLATLTGAQVVALGEIAAAAMGTRDSLIESIKTAGKSAGEKFWQMPLYDEYKATLKSDVADLINAGSKGQAGTCSAGMFLKEFVDEGRAWAHLDIAGPAYTSRDFPEVPKGATGFAVRTLLYYLYGLTE